jgi:hypothetical protein
MSFFETLNDYGILEIRTVKQTAFIEKEDIGEFERVLRLHDDLGINFEGIDVINRLLKRIEALESELLNYKNKLDFYK